MVKQSMICQGTSPNKLSVVSQHICDIDKKLLLCLPSTMH